jgi:DNA-directed RNA polymerase subunit RPC12/RpoP
MKKENARTKPADEKEVGNIYGRKFKCEKCGLVKLFDVSSIEFGEEIRCKECGGVMCRAI